MGGYEPRILGSHRDEPPGGRLAEIASRGGKSTANPGGDPNAPLGNIVPSFVKPRRAAFTWHPGTRWALPRYPIPSPGSRACAAVSRWPPFRAKKIRFECPFPSSNAVTAGPPHAAPLVGLNAPGHVRTLNPRIRVLRSVPRCGGRVFGGGKRGSGNLPPTPSPSSEAARAMRRRSDAVAHGRAKSP